MRHLRTVWLTIALVGISTIALAAGDWSTSWNGVIGQPSNEYTIGAAVVHYDGVKTITFIAERTRDEQNCSFAGTTLWPPNETVIYVDDQAIKAIAKCFLDNGTYIYNVWPKTAAGRKYVISLFKAKVTAVTVTINQQRFLISTNGFTKVWNSVSDDVL